MQSVFLYEENFTLYMYFETQNIEFTSLTVQLTCMTVLCLKKMRVLSLVTDQFISISHMLTSSGVAQLLQLCLFAAS